MKLVHIGGYPPPYGGVASHVKRLHQLCLQHGIDSIVLDTSGRSKEGAPRVIAFPGRRVVRLCHASHYLWQSDADVIHLHLSSLDSFRRFAPPLLLASRRAMRVVSLHSGSFVPKARALAPIVARYVGALLRCYHHIVVANCDQAEYLATGLGIEPDAISVVAPFLPLQSDEVAAIPPSLADCFERFPDVVVMTGFGRPYYGFDTVIKAMDRLRSNSLALVVHTYTTEDRAYMHGISDLANARPWVYMSHGELTDAEMAILLKRSRIFVRATAVDGDSLALREAALAGLQILATDCVPRPRGTLLFPFGDEEQCAAALNRALKEPLAGIASDTELGSGHKLLHIYRALSA